MFFSSSFSLIDTHAEGDTIKMFVESLFWTEFSFKACEYVVQFESIKCKNSLNASLFVNVKNYFAVLISLVLIQIFVLLVKQ